MSISINMTSKSFTSKVTALIMAGTKPADAVAEAIAAEQAAHAIKQATTLAKAAIFAARISMEQELPVDSSIIEAVKSEFTRRAFEKSQGLKPSNYACFAAVKVSSAWRKANWNTGACYASVSTIETLKKAYSL